MDDVSVDFSDCPLFLLLVGILKSIIIFVMLGLVNVIKDFEYILQCRISKHPALLFFLWLPIDIFVVAFHYLRLYLIIFRYLYHENTPICLYLKRMQPLHNGLVTVDDLVKEPR